MRKERSRRSALLVILVFFILFASFCYLLHEARHECVDETCPVCVMISICRDTLGGFALSLLLFAFLFATLCAALFLRRERDPYKSNTPVSRRDRLLS